MKKFFTLLAAAAVGVCAYAASPVTTWTAQIVVLDGSYNDYYTGTRTLYQLDDGSYEIEHVMLASGGEDNLFFALVDDVFDADSFYGTPTWDTTYAGMPYWYYNYCEAADYDESGMYFYTSSAYSYYVAPETDDDTATITFTTYTGTACEDIIPAGYAYVYFYWVPSEGTSGISSIISEENATPVYYNLNGVQVENPTSGLYIVKQGNKVSKQIIR